MDPDPTASLSRMCCFPRTRGDGPYSLLALWPFGKFPPHARGWTVSEPVLYIDPTVSPARAGMDRHHLRELDRSRQCFPRTRGDGPVCIWTSHTKNPFPPHARGWTVLRRGFLLRPAVSPARAGMDPSPTTTGWSPSRFPRTRGDGPHLIWWLHGRATFPPHARGWTESTSGGSTTLTVSPARAGMDPSHSILMPAAMGFPRTRGDGP